MNNKVRVNITVDKELLDKAKGKLHLFGGKLSTLFNSYLKDFIDSIDKKFDENAKVQHDKIEEMDNRIKKLEKELRKN